MDNQQDANIDTNVHHTNDLVSDLAGDSMSVGNCVVGKGEESELSSITNSFRHLVRSQVARLEQRESPSKEGAHQL